jgi:hypothetical protein
MILHHGENTILAGSSSTGEQQPVGCHAGRFAYVFNAPCHALLDLGTSLALIEPTMPLAAETLYATTLAIECERNQIVDCSKARIAVPQFRYPTTSGDTFTSTRRQSSRRAICATAGRQPLIAAYTKR